MNTRVLNTLTQSHTPLHAYPHTQLPGLVELRAPLHHLPLWRVTQSQQNPAFPLSSLPKLFLETIAFKKLDYPHPFFPL